MNLPEPLIRHHHFIRYYRTWQKNPLSLVFIPMTQICREQGLLTDAREICEAGLSRHPESVSGRLMLARVYFDMERLEEAGDIVREILSALPVQQEAQTLLEKIRRCLGTEVVSPPTTVPSGKPAVTLWENLTMAQIYADQGEKAIARRIVEKILSREPENLVAQRMREELRT